MSIPEFTTLTVLLYAHIAKALGTSVDEVRAAAERIRQLSPNPSAGFEDRDNIYYGTRTHGALPPYLISNQAP